MASGSSRRAVNRRSYSVSQVPPPILESRGMIGDFATAFRAPEFSGAPRIPSGTARRARPHSPKRACIRLEPGFEPSEHFRWPSGESAPFGLFDFEFWEGERAGQLRVFGRHPAGRRRVAFDVEPLPWLETLPMATGGTRKNGSPSTCWPFPMASGSSRRAVNRRSYSVYTSSSTYIGSRSLHLYWKAAG